MKRRSARGWLTKMIQKMRSASLNGGAAAHERERSDALLIDVESVHAGRPFSGWDVRRPKQIHACTLRILAALA